MKIKKILPLSALLIGISVLFASFATATTEIDGQYSIFTPNRDGVVFKEGIQGFSYPSFNNFTSSFRNFLFVFSVNLSFARFT